MENKQNQVDIGEFIINKLLTAKRQFERALDCKRTEFDDLYPYISEHPQFFWYKRYVAWSELLTIVKLADELGVYWPEHFTQQQVEYIAGKVMHSEVLDHWYEGDGKEREEVKNQMGE